MVRRMRRRAPSIPMVGAIRMGAEAPWWKVGMLGALRLILRCTIVLGPLALPLLKSTDVVQAARGSAPAVGWVGSCPTAPSIARFCAARRE